MRPLSNLGVGAALTGSLALAALSSLAWTPYPPAAIDILHRLAPPGLAHPLGSDPFGRDMLSMLMAGLRNTSVVCLLSVLLGALLGVPLGLASAGRHAGSVPILRLCDLIFAFPPLLTGIMVVAVSAPGMLSAVIAIGVFDIPVFARVTRAAALTVLTQDYILAARLAGRGWPKILLVHVLPNIAGGLLVQATLLLGLAVTLEAALNYLGLGTQPPAPSLGRMLRDYQTYIHRTALLVICPGVAIAALVLGLNLLGDGLRDRLDPRGPRGG